MTPVEKVIKWYKDEFGETLKSKKIMAYSEVSNGIKSGPILCNEN